MSPRPWEDAPLVEETPSEAHMRSSMSRQGLGDTTDPRCVSQHVVPATAVALWAAAIGSEFRALLVKVFRRLKQEKGSSEVCKRLEL